MISSETPYKFAEIIRDTWPNLYRLPKRNLKMEKGNRVKFIGCSKEQIAWGNNDNPYMLILDRIYTITDVEIHSQHTKIQLKGIIGKFNSVCFEIVQ